ncbi:ATP-binding protein [Actinomadura flavalba]|uniref:ATP-binding protein n=1 Tax=Actinomadura flavalba TaxID=1120938 RepID=UPI00052761B1|nr:ATP-binding protein [Actinomadura flavalba]
MISDRSNYRIVSPSLTVKAMRDSGYKNTAYALAELIDNSIDAKATLVEVFACESPVQVGSRTSHHVETIAVLDNGHGMEEPQLRRALKYGDGDGADPDRIGRFGMGLPNSSMSQCTRLDVWSWTQGAGNALHTYLSLEEIEQGLVDDVPEPKHDPLPQHWRDLSEGLGDSGTLIMWTDLDKVNWHGAAATLKNTAELIGRVYRHYLQDGRVDIRMAPVREGKVVDGEYHAVPNDPLYLMVPTSTPNPFSDKQMFMPFSMGDDSEAGVAPFPVLHEGKRYNITVRASIARPEARRGDVEGHPWPRGSRAADPGNLPWGKHAKRNVGVSLVRQGRELDLDASWAIGYDPRERWWGIEVEFPPELDSIFGVTNNKQSATVFSSLAHFDWRVHAEAGESFKEFKERLADLGDPRLPLIDLVLYLEEKLLPAIRRQLKQQTHGTSKGKKRHNEDAASRATDAVKRRSEEGHTGKTDELEAGTTTEDKRQEQVAALTERHHLDEDIAQSMVDEALKKDLRARWISSFQDTSAFFSIDLMAGMLQVIFNEKHPLHAQLMAVLEDVPEDADANDLRDRLNRAAETFKLLLFSWARMEDETHPDKLRERIADARRLWGQYARDFVDGTAD